jgi:hypothetical protein
MAVEQGNGDFGTRGHIAHHCLSTIDSEPVNSAAFR